MLDLASILFTTVLCVFVTLRAMDMDRRLPWFGRRAAEAPPDGKDAARRRRA